MTSEAFGVPPEWKLDQEGIIHASEQQLDYSRSTDLLRAKIRNYSLQQRADARVRDWDSLRFGLGEIQVQIRELYNLSTKDVSYLSARIKRRKSANVEDMYRLSHAFLQSVDNIRTFAKIPGALAVIIKELIGIDSKRQMAAIECLCNLSLGELPICSKITQMAGSYLVTYLDSNSVRLKRTSLWTLTNLLATGSKLVDLLIQMELVPKLWNLYVHNECKTGKDKNENCRNDVAFCLHIIVTRTSKLRQCDREVIQRNFMTEQPTSLGTDYHLQILFNCGIASDDFVLNKEQILYLINYALWLLDEFSIKVDLSDHLWRIVYAIRILNNVIDSQSTALKMFISQRNFVGIFNMLFALKNEMITKEVFWFLKTVLRKIPSAMCDSLLNTLQVPQMSIF